jgi:hypothetical protein
MAPLAMIGGTIQKSGTQRLQPEKKISEENQLGKKYHK